MELKVTQRFSETEIECEVIVGGKLTEKKGINVPDIIVSSRLSEKDKEDAKYAVEQELDYICASFVQTAEDVIELREFMKQHAKPGTSLIPNPSHIQKHISWAGRLPLIISKIEKPQAVDHIREILEATDGIMVARGDLGVEMNLEKVPAIQKMLIDLSNEMQKPVITATQMLQSMIENPVPTRAEVSDVANAVFDGSDCVMLSAESAVGTYPVESVKTMVRIIAEAEHNLTITPRLNRQAIRDLAQSVGSNQPGVGPRLSHYETIARCAVSAAKEVRAVAIIVISYSGLMANRISKYKPDIPIIGLTGEPHAYHRMALLGGVHPLLIKFAEKSEETLHDLEKQIEKRNMIQKGDVVVFCAGTTNAAAISNTLKVYKFGEFLDGKK
jgi:pyruvate kinase